MITDKARDIQKYKAIATDTSYTPRTRIAAARRLLKISDHPDGRHTDGCTRVARRIAKKFLKDPAISAKDRSSALRLWETIMGAPTVPDDNLDDNTEGLAALKAAAEPLQLAPQHPTHIAPGSDGFMHYTNAEGKDFGRVPEGEENVERTERPVVSPFPEGL